MKRLWTGEEGGGGGTAAPQAWSDFMDNGRTDLAEGWFAAAAEQGSTFESRSTCVLINSEQGGIRSTGSGIFVEVRNRLLRKS